MSNKFVVFENLTNVHRIPVLWYRLMGYGIEYLKVEMSASNTQWFQKLQASGDLRRLELKEPLYLVLMRSPEPAFDVVDEIYSTAYQNNSMVRRAQKLYESEEIQLAFKKGLLWELEKYAFYQIMKTFVGRALPEANKIILVPEDVVHGDTPKAYSPLLARCDVLYKPIGDNPSIPSWTKPIAVFKDLKHKAKVCGVAAKSIAESSIRLVTTFWKQYSPAHFTYGIAMVNPLREFANEIRKPDFLLDGVTIRGDNTLFIPPSNTGTSSIVKEMQSNYQTNFRDKRLNISEITRSASLNDWIGVVITEALSLACVMLFRTWITDVAAHVARDYWIWSGFIASYRIDHFVTYSDLGIGHVGRNILLNRNGARSWLYLDSLATGENYLTAEVSGRPYRSSAWGFLKYDQCISWNQRNVNYLREHKQEIGKYSVVGCLWSEHVNMVKAGLIGSRFEERLVEAGYSDNLKLVVAFDTTYGTEEIGDFRDGVAFIDGLGRLIEENPDIFVVLKEKKPRYFLGSNPWTHNHDIHGIHETLDAFGAHERVWLPGYETNPEEVMASADFVVSFPFTSTTLEALGANIPAVFYDPLGKFYKTTNAQIPNLVAHGYDAFKKAAMSALNGKPADIEQRGDSLLDFRVLDPFMDAKGLTRFRQLLCATRERSS